MKCRLCSRTERLVNSHILPELLYKACCDEKHRGRGVALPEFKKSFFQKGHREKLLCLTCEGRFSRYERYFAQIWYGPTRRWPLFASDPFFTIEDLDYAYFKLFHLSILWRAAVSTRPEYHSVDLGPHAERPKRFLLHDDPGKDHQYPIEVMAIMNPETKGFFEGFMVSPEKKKVEAHTIFLFVFGGCAWCYCVSSYEAPWFPKSLSEDWTLMVPCRHFRSFPLMSELVGHYAEGLRRSKGTGTGAEMQPAGR